MNPFAEIGPALPDPFRLLWREEVGSTNDELRQLAEQGMGEGLILVADYQAAGRGRRGSGWFAPKGENLVFSVLLKPGEPKVLWGRLALIAGLAVAEGLEKFVPRAEVKWPNDVMVGGKKICGILVETGGDYAVVGIGINVNTASFPEEVNAISLRMEGVGVISRADVLLEVMKCLRRYMDAVGDDFAEVLQGLAGRCWLTGKMVELTRLEKRERGVVRGLGDGGELLIEIGGQLLSVVQADEVRVCDGEE